jgi:hypothetical protein
MLQVALLLLGCALSRYLWENQQDHRVGCPRCHFIRFPFLPLHSHRWNGVLNIKPLDRLSSATCGREFSPSSSQLEGRAKRGNFISTIASETVPHQLGDCPWDLK